MTMLEALRAPVAAALMSLPPVSPARTSACPVGVKASLELAQAYGPKSPVWLGNFDQASLSWKTRQHSLFEDSKSSSPIWPRSGMTRNGIAYHRAPLVEAKNETGCGLLPTLPKSEPRDCSQAQILARLDKGGRVARRICATSQILRSSADIVTINPSFAEWLAGYQEGWTE
mgnify:CR=1 FL=1